MFLLRMRLTSAESDIPRGVSVWIDESDPGRAATRATGALAAEGLRVERIDEVIATDADDYFQPCPSQQAFERARQHGIAWRFDDAT